LARLHNHFEPFTSFVGFTHNAAVEVGRWINAGSRLWTAPEAPPMPGGEMGDEAQKPDYIERETRRLQLSIDDAKAREAKSTSPRVRVCAVHFPPMYSNRLETAFSRTLEAWQPMVCVYGHLHGPGIGAGFVGEHGGVKYVLASCDAAQFTPVLLDER
jgi:predicted phosphohydrolase